MGNAPVERLRATSICLRDFSVVEQNSLRHWCAIEFGAMEQAIRKAFFRRRRGGLYGIFAPPDHRSLR
jgi:hypothetical protein